MTSKRQAVTNRRNAQLLTGPNTPAGKAVSRWNALRHGLRAELVVLPDENVEDYSVFRQALVGELQPGGEMEAILIDRIISTAWRLQRLGRVEAGLFVRNHYDALAERAKTAAHSHERTSLDLMQESLDATTITDEEAHARAVEQAAKAEALRDADTNAMAAAFVRDRADSFGKLARHEAALERSLYKALHELQRLQAGRAGGPVPFPVAVDVNVGTDCPVG